MATESQERGPYIGPRPFEQEEKDFFFGRDREVSEILSLVIAHRVLLVYAQSGAGKTSLINAGLIHLLEEEEFEVLPPARVGGLIPEGIPTKQIPNLYVLNTLMGWAEEADVGQLAEMSLADFLKKPEHPTDADGLPSPRIVIFDQFEELFAFYRERWRERKGFFEQVRDALEQDPFLRVVFVIREDYIARLDPYTPLLPEQLRTRFRLERLRREVALAAVEEPARKANRPFAKGVAKNLVEDLMKVRVEIAPGKTEDVEGEFVEPVQLQVVCEGLWRRLGPNATEITDEDRRAFGDVDRALSRFYERSLSAAQDVGAKEEDLRSLFEHILITPAETRGTVFRGQEKTGAIQYTALGALDKLLVKLRLKRLRGIPNKAVDVLDGLHIIRGESRAGARWYELTHDRLIEPIRQSNKTWRERQAQQRVQKGRVAITSGMGVAALVGVVVSGVLTGWWETDQIPEEITESGATLIQAEEEEIVISPAVRTDCYFAAGTILDSGGAKEELVPVDPKTVGDDECVFTPLAPLRFRHEHGEEVSFLSIAPEGDITESDGTLSKFDEGKIVLSPDVGADCSSIVDIALGRGGDDEELIPVRQGTPVGDDLCLLTFVVPLLFPHEAGQNVLFTTEGGSTESGILKQAEEARFFISPAAVGTDCSIITMITLDPGGDSEELDSVNPVTSVGDGGCVVTPAESIQFVHEPGEKVRIISVVPPPTPTPTPTPEPRR